MPAGRRIHGVDFSGAADAGDGIWVASGTFDGERFDVTRCYPARELADTADRDPVLSELRAFLRDAQDAVVGADFPFGLPAPLVDANGWEPFLERFGDRFDGPHDLEETCIERAERLTGGERGFLLRATDAATGAKCPYHWLVRHQTYFGIGDVLAPLVLADDAAVPPMHGVGSDQVALVEVYPAGTLDRLDLPTRAYKKPTDEARSRRETILDGLPVDISADLRERVLSDADGDALDAVVAGVAAARALSREFAPELDWRPLEGHIYI